MCCCCVTKSIINVQVGEEEYKRQARIVRDHGAAVVVMAFDEEGQVCGG
jgi:5-methyltetrahydrofolate--homocysteine methyltransferase